MSIVRKGQNISGIEPRRPVTETELREHNTRFNKNLKYFLEIVRVDFTAFSGYQGLGIFLLSRFSFSEFGIFKPLGIFIPRISDFLKYRDFSDIKLPLISDLFFK